VTRTSRPPWPTSRSRAHQFLVDGRHTGARDVVRRVDDGVARDDDLLAAQRLQPQCGGCCLGGGQVQRGDPGDQLPVALLGKRRGEVARAQPGLQVHNGDRAPERGKRTGERRRRVALHEHRGRRPPHQQVVEFGQERRHQLGLRSGVPGDVEPLVGREAERRERLLDRVTVLSTVDYDGPQSGLCGQIERHRRRLDRLRAGADQQQDVVGHKILSRMGATPLRRVLAYPPKQGVSRRRSSRVVVCGFCPRAARRIRRSAA
jgi:hypothetical protein